MDDDFELPGSFEILEDGRLAYLLEPDQVDLAAGIVERELTAGETRAIGAWLVNELGPASAVTVADAAINWLQGRRRGPTLKNALGWYWNVDEPELGNLVEFALTRAFGNTWRTWPDDARKAAVSELTTELAGPFGEYDTTRCPETTKAGTRCRNNVTRTDGLCGSHTRT